MIVVDTNAFIWLAHGDPMAAPALTAIDAAVRSSVILVPSIVAWEIGLAVSKGRLKLAIDVEEWLARALVLPGVREVPLAADVALASTRLPGVFHADPADRLIVAQAREFDAPLLTSDRSILAYAKAGHLKAIRAR